MHLLDLRDGLLDLRGSLLDRPSCLFDILFHLLLGLFEQRRGAGAILRRQSATVFRQYEWCHEAFSMRCPSMLHISQKNMKVPNIIQRTPSSTLPDCLAVSTVYYFQGSRFYSSGISAVHKYLVKHKISRTTISAMPISGDAVLRFLCHRVLHTSTGWNKVRQRICVCEYCFQGCRAPA